MEVDQKIFSTNQVNLFPTEGPAREGIVETISGLTLEPPSTTQAKDNCLSSSQVPHKRWRCIDPKNIHETIARCDGLAAMIDRVIARTKLIKTMTSKINQNELETLNKTDLNKVNKVRHQVCEITHDHCEALIDSVTHREATYEGVVQRSKKMNSDIHRLSVLLNQRNKEDIHLPKEDASSFHHLLAQKDVESALSLLNDLAKLQNEQEIAQQQFEALQQFEGKQQEIIGEFRASVFKSLQERFAKINLKTLPQHDRNDLTDLRNRLLIEITKSAQAMHKQVCLGLGQKIGSSSTSESIPSKRIVVFEDDLSFNDQMAQDLEFSKELSGEIAVFLELVRLEDKIECYLNADVGKALQIERSKEFDEIKKRLPSTRSLPGALLRQVALIKQYKNAISEIYTTMTNKLKKLDKIDSAIEKNQTEQGQEG